MVVGVLGDEQHVQLAAEGGRGGKRVEREEAV